MDKLHTFYGAFGQRLSSGKIVRGGNSLQWIVDVLEWMDAGNDFADELSPPGMDDQPDYEKDAREWELCRQLVVLCLISATTAAAPASVTW
jgi:hypothetical protein